MIKTLTLKNFRKHKDTTMELDKVNWIVGPSGAGKTSILSALEYVLSFRSEWIDVEGVAKSVGMKYQVKRGADKALVEITTDDGKKITRTIPRGKNEPSALISEDIAHACLECRAIVDLPAKDQKDLFFQFFQEPEQNIFEMLNTWDGEFPDLGTRFQQYCLDEYQYDVQEIDTLHKIAYESRAVRKKLLEEKIKTNEGLKTAMTPKESISQKDLDKVKKQVQAVGQKYEEEIKRLSALKTDWNFALEQWRSLEFKQSQAQKKVKECEDAVAGIAKSIGKEVTSDLQTEGKNLQVVTEALEKLQKEIAALTGDERCPMGKCARVELKALNEKLDEAMYERDQTKGRFSELTHQNNNRVEAQKRYKDASKKWEEAKNALGELGTLPQQPEEPQVDTTEKDKIKVELEKANAYLEKMQGLFSEGVALRKLEETYQNSLAEIEETEIRVRMFESLVKALKPDGLKTQLLGGVKDELEALLNEGLQFYGFAAKIEMDPWWILIDTGNGEGYIPDKYLSKSEKSRVSTVYQAIIAEKSGFPFIGVDGFELDPTKRGDMLNFLFTSDVQSLVCNTSSSMDNEGNIVVPEDLGIAGIKTFFVSDGTVKQV